MKKPPYFNFYPKDFASDDAVELMSTTAVGAYILLLCKAWHQDPPASLPNDDLLLARFARLTLDDWRQVKPEVLRAFTLGTDGRLYQKRLRSEYEGFLRKASKARESAQKRWVEMRTHSEGNANALREHCEGNARGSESDSGSESGSSGGVGSAEGKGDSADRIYAAYPRKVGRTAAIKAIRRALDSLGNAQVMDGTKPPAWLLERTTAYANATAAWSVHDRQFIPHPATWFNQGRFHDDDSTWQRNSNGNGKASARAEQRAREFDETLPDAKIL